MICTDLPAGLRILLTSRSMAAPLSLTSAVSSDMRASRVPLSTTASKDPSSYLPRIAFFIASKINSETREGGRRRTCGGASQGERANRGKE